MISISAEDLRAIKGKACGVFWSMTKIWRSHEMPLALKLNIFDATCVSVLLYGSEAWSVTGAMRKTIDAFATTAYMIDVGYPVQGSRL